jgi:hypothetical protein
MASRLFPFPALLLGATILAGSVDAQVIPFESNGLKYQALTRGGVTIMFAPLPTRIRDWVVFQIAITNGSQLPWAFKAEDFRFERNDGSVVQALAAHQVVETMLKKASRNDTTKLVVAYEAALFNNMQLHSTNGYESRRQGAMAELGSNKLKAAATASAIVLAPARLAPGESTDGAIFYPTGGKPLGSGRFMVNAAAEEFEFPVELEFPNTSHR